MMKKPLFTVGIMLLGTASAVGIEITTPQGGWRNSNNEKMKFTQTVNYPASSVAMQEDQSKASMIRGKVNRTRKPSPKDDQGDKPHQMIVNGVSMPLRVEGDSFARPYIFGSGSNSIEVRSPDGKERARVQFHESNPNATQPRLTVLLSWDTNNTDLDLHVISPDGQHAWYGQRVVDNGGAIDVDVTTGYGPEIFSSPSPVKGNYLVYVNYYGSGPRDDLTVAQVTVITNQNTADEKKETVSVPMRKAGELTLVHSFVSP